MLRFYRTITILFIAVFAVIFTVPLIRNSFAADKYPKLANYFLSWKITSAEAEQLAKWDVLILDMETQANSKVQLERIRELNPDIIMLAYVTSQEIKTDVSSAGEMRRKLATRVDDGMYLRNLAGNRITFWPGTEMLNLSDNAPLVNGARWNGILARFVVDEVLSTGFWDGVFYDNAWDGLSWLTGTNVDLNRDGAIDENVDRHWQAGMKYLFNETRRLTNNNFLIVGNANGKAYSNELNGAMLENFPNLNGWKGTMEVYKFFEENGKSPKILIINRNTLNKGTKNDYRSVRYGLATTLLEDDGYYSFDHGDKDHGQTWWYDEYDVNLGAPTGEAQSIGGAGQYTADVWRRDFDNGIALVNSTGETKTVDLGGEYEKISGTQDPKVNNGLIADKVKLSATDGIIMMKTYRQLVGAPFRNGAFARFFRADGNRSRNGFFVFEEGIAGGARVFRGDLDGVGGVEKIVVTGPRLEIFNSVGEHWLDDFPFGAGFRGEIFLSIGKLGKEKKDSIIVTASRGGQAIGLSYFGGVTKEVFFPFGKNYTRSIRTAIGDVDKDGSGEAVFAGSELAVWDGVLKKTKKQFQPYGKNFKGTMNLAVGDVNSDRVGEILTVSSGTSEVKIWDSAGKKKGAFTVKGLIKPTSIELGVVDVGGRSEIVVFSAN